MNEKRRWLKPLARAGYASRGVVYLIVGAFAFLSAFGPSDHKDSKGALLTLLQQPFGQALVLLMIVGLLGYVGWRLVQSLLDTDDHGWSPKGIVVRGGLLASAATHAVLALYALSLLYPTITGASADSGDDPTLADRISAVVGMTPVLFVLCVVFAGTAIAHWYKAATRRYERHFDASDNVMRFVHPISILGLAARGTIWAVLSLLLVLRLLRDSSGGGDPPGMQDALRYIQELPMGNFLLAMMGAGLVLFAGYSISEALWRRINIDDAG